MNEQGFPNHPASIAGGKKLRLKIITSNGRRFICPVSYECTVQRLADRILDVYTQFQRDPTHRYYALNNKIACRVHNIRSHSYHLGRTDYIAELLNDLDQIECDVEQVECKKKTPAKRETPVRKGKKINKKKTKRERAKQKKREKTHLTNLKDQAKVQTRHQQTPKSQPQQQPEIPPLKKLSVDLISEGKHSPRTFLLDNPPILKQISLTLKRSHQKSQEKKSPKSQVKPISSPKPQPLESRHVQKIQRIKDRLRPKEKCRDHEKDSKQIDNDKAKQSADKDLKQVKDQKDLKLSKELKEAKPQPEQQITRPRKRSCVILLEQDRQDQSFNIYSKKHVEANKKQIFNRFDDDDDDDDDF